MDLYNLDYSVIVQSLLSKHKFVQPEVRCFRLWELEQSVVAGPDGLVRRICPSFFEAEPIPRLPYQGLQWECIELISDTGTHSRVVMKLIDLV